jgi:hypothetical protein
MLTADNEEFVIGKTYYAIIHDYTQSHPLNFPSLNMIEGELITMPNIFKNCSLRTNNDTHRFLNQLIFAHKQNALEQMRKSAIILIENIERASK